MVIFELHSGWLMFPFQPVWTKICNTLRNLFLLSTFIIKHHLKNKAWVNKPHFEICIYLREKKLHQVTFPHLQVFCECRMGWWVDLKGWSRTEAGSLCLSLSAYCSSGRHEEWAAFFRVLETVTESDPSSLPLPYQPDTVPETSTFKSPKLIWFWI